MLYDKIATAEQRVQVGVNFEWQDAGLGNIPLNIQPLQGEFKNMQSGIFFKTYKAFTSNGSVVEGMRLTVNGEQFIVRGRQRYDYIALPHYELIIEAGDK